MTDPNACELRVTRGHQFTDRLRDYKIFVNGSEVGTVSAGSELDVEVPSGPLAIEARIDWARSQPFNVDALPGDTIAVEVSNRWSPLTALWAITFGSRNYLTVKPAEPSAPQAQANA